MSDTKFTPGPWKWDGDHIARFDVYQDERGIIATLDPWGHLEETKANARLMAAAPELYESLKLLLADLAGYEAYEKPLYAVDVAIAALAKARGES